MKTSSFPTFSFLALLCTTTVLSSPSYRDSVRRDPGPHPPFPFKTLNRTAGPPPEDTELHTGDITWFNVSLGACGWMNDGYAQDVVALSYKLMGNQSWGNPYCGRTITVSYKGKYIQPMVVDKCADCEDPDNIDLSVQAFSELADLGVGRDKATWWFNN
ncbi:hypothetical protein FGG08_004129 [Glutinoglossum americanum]|uniref:RlpA-like protein double-psi beta-barrel domain-containing protein n=1 Tax=Glutinoglossum americanum TaxID=1670608 RepID=A0A9P8I849_9PEZI|nr:hypothetical protein FGG08_004129 [Glutinoglossum americanum]